jgi:hypothetical protein
MTISVPSVPPESTNPVVRSISPFLRVTGGFREQHPIRRFSRDKWDNAFSNKVLIVKEINMTDDTAGKPLIMMHYVTWERGRRDGEAGRRPHPGADGLSYHSGFVEGRGRYLREVSEESASRERREQMIIHDNDDFLGPDAPTCFYCYNAIRWRPFIEWASSGGAIFLHPACAVDLVLRLLRDVHEIECRYHQRTNFCREDAVTNGDWIMRTVQDAGAKKAASHVREGQS